MKICMLVFSLDCPRTRRACPFPRSACLTSQGAVPPSSDGAATSTAALFGPAFSALGGTSPGKSGDGLARASSTRAAMAAGSSPIQCWEAASKRAVRVSASSARTAANVARQVAPMAAAAAVAAVPAPAPLSPALLAALAFLAALAATSPTWRMDARDTRAWRAASALAVAAAASAVHCLRRAVEERWREEG